MRVGKLVRTSHVPERLRLVGLLHDRWLGDPVVGGGAFLANDWSLVGECPESYVEVEATVRGWPLEELMKFTDDTPSSHPPLEWTLSDVRVVAVLGDDWRGDETCERDVPPWPAKR